METIERKESQFDSALMEEDINQLQPLMLYLSEEEQRKVQAASWYNDYPSNSAYAKDVLLKEVDSDKERHLRSKESNKVKK